MVLLALYAPLAVVLLAALSHQSFGFTLESYRRPTTTSLLRARAEAADGFDGGSMRNETAFAGSGSEMSSSLEKRLNSLKFGFETKEKIPPPPKKTNLSKLLTSQIALCYSNSNSEEAEGAIYGSIDPLPRMRGCQPLLDDKNYAAKPEVIGDISSRAISSSSSSPQFSFGAVPLPLPCVVSGTCPYTQFRCSKGHRWAAEPGKPVCFHCPVCEMSRKVCV
jgi:hypothetical protein